jgi:signal transduction histidine kinase
MNAILGFSEILIDKKVGELNDKQLEYLKDIHASGAHLLQLINDVLDLSKIESGKKELRPESFLLKDIVEEIISVLAPLAIKNGIRIRTDLSPEVKNVWADKRQFRQILYNLVSNAIKFNVTGGSILISMSLSGLEHFKLTVGDTGIGIAPEGLRKLFMPFAQLHAPSSGAIESTGLGLTLTKTIVEHHHGTIKVESIPGKGSVFIVTLPINTPRQAPGHA